MIEKKVPELVPVPDEKPPVPTTKQELLEWHAHNIDGLLKKEEEKTKP